jgi:ABC-type lipoprotein export system ATPase subunit
MYEQPNVEKLNEIKECKVEDNKGIFITGNAGCGKTYSTNQLISQLDPSTYRTCTPTHKSALLIDGETFLVYLISILMTLPT